MQRYIVSNITTSPLSDQDIHHILHVMRGEIATKFIIVDSSTNSEYIATITGIKPFKYDLKLLDNSTSKLPKITLFCSLLKNNNFELVIQKATELGVSKIIPFISSRTIVRLSKEDFGKKLARYQTIIKEASEQSKSLFLPEITMVIDFKEINNYLADYNLIAYENSNNSIEIEKGKSTNIVIGPEGGFSFEEVASLTNYTPISLSSKILRSETAAIAAIAILGYLL